MAHLVDDVGPACDEETQGHMGFATTPSWSSPGQRHRSLTCPWRFRRRFAIPREQSSKLGSVSACPLSLLALPCAGVLRADASSPGWRASDLRGLVGNPNHHRKLLKGKTIGDRLTRIILDGYNQIAPSPARARPSASRNFLPRRNHSRLRCALMRL